jgi:hypothetical protein
MQQIIYHDIAEVHPSEKQIERIADRIINKLIDSGDPLVDTLALMLNQKAVDAINHGRREHAKGKGVPLDALVD